MKTVSMVVQVTPEKKALHLCQEYAEIQTELSELKAEFPPRSECEQITVDNRQTCRDLKIEHCPRCEATEPLAQEWHKLKARKSNVLKKIHALGCKALDGI
ncbi:hypothetical protein J7438_13485 [Thalassotalea sp. G20_0]|uniref:hypothetical protein n=1 Tax=Thalassotalea sp. G20_0 TaxID=2821093 RepID=UPI001ADA825C|nr:hypothetical protein [Thalassotalea sp. G20_0]MBO9495092.1 hypothetical protein [Thalassotalea sp. G20_0]